MSKLRLETTDSQFRSLHEARDYTRASSRTVTVDRAALTALLLDHSRMAAALGNNLEEPPDTPPQSETSPSP
jgi:hypothetical protein